MYFELIPLEQMRLHIWITCMMMKVMLPIPIEVIGTDEVAHKENLYDDERNVVHTHRSNSNYLYPTGM